MRDLIAVAIGALATALLAVLLYVVGGALEVALPLYPTMGLIGTFVVVFALTSGRLKQIGNSSSGYFAAFNEVARKPLEATDAVIEAAYDKFAYMEKPSTERFFEAFASVDPDKKYIAFLRLGTSYEVNAVHVFWSNISLKVLDFVFVIVDEDGRYVCTLDVWRRFAADSPRNYQRPPDWTGIPHSPTAVELKALLESVQAKRSSECRRSWLCQVASIDKAATRSEAITTLRLRQAQMLVLTDKGAPVGYIRKDELIADIVEALAASSQDA
jgi:hypothetical protein